MRSEMERANWWAYGWNYVIAMMENMDEKSAWRWQKRFVWAWHRAEIATRASLSHSPVCWYCERPGHDEAQSPCPRRQMDAKRWQAFGKMWRGKEGA